MKVSIIIPIFKVEKYIKRCINSVINQTYSNIEVLLIDDQSPDQSLAIAKSLLDSSNLPTDRIKYIIHPTNRGISAARNSGIDAATGNSLYFLDSDDSITSDCIEHLVNNMLATNADIVTSGFRTIHNNRFKDMLPKENNLDSDGTIRSLLNKEICVMVWNKLIRKEYIIQNNLYFKEGIIHEDELWSIMMAICVKKMTTIPTITYYYYIRDNSITSTNEIIRLQNFIIVWEDIIIHLKKQKYITSEIINYINQFAFWRYYSVIHTPKIPIRNRYKYHKMIAKIHRSCHTLIPIHKNKFGILSLPYGIGFVLSIVTHFIYRLRCRLISLKQKIKS